MKLPNISLKKVNKFFKIFLKKNVLFFAVVGIILLIEGFLFLAYSNSFSEIVSYFKKPVPLVPGTILFYGENCRHCTTVDNFIKNNKLEDKVPFTRLEVFHNEINADILADRAQICGLDETQIGVPFLWDGEHCIIGYVDVINFFRAKIK